MTPLDIEWSDLDEALDADSVDHSAYLDRQSGAVLIVSNTVRQAVEDGEEDRLLAWQRHDLELATAVAQDVAGDRYLLIEPRTHGFRWHIRHAFACEIADVTLRDELLQALEEAAALKGFIEVLADHRAALAQWTAWQHRVQREAATAWLEARGIAPRFLA